VATQGPDLVAAIAQLLRSDPQRTLAVADSLRGSGRRIESTVSGSSMGAGLPPGSRIRIDLVPRPVCEAGEVIAYVAGDQIIVHRVLHRGRAGRARGHLIAFGDAVLVPDPPVQIAYVLGPVTEVWQAERWTPTAGPLPRSTHARLVRALLAALSTAGLYLSPRATARVLLVLHRGAGALRGAAAAALHRRRARRPGPS
jgi:hypothetical protein